MNRIQCAMIENLSVINDLIIKGDGDPFEIVSDFTKISGSETINKKLEKLLCANSEQEIRGVFDNDFIEDDYKRALNKIFLKMYKKESFTLDDII